MNTIQILTSDDSMTSPEFKGNKNIDINKIYHNDWMNNTLEDKSVQLIIADPPYFEVKGEFDFVWKSFAHYLADVERWALECKRILAENGTLFWYGNSKKIAYSQIILDKYFNLESSLLWRKTDSIQYQYYSPDLARTFNTHNERLLMYSVGEDYHDNVRLSIKFIQDYLNTITTRNELAEMLLQIGNCRNAESAKQNANNILSQRSAKPQMITEQQYNLIKNKNKKEYKILLGEYENQKRFFYNPNKYEEVLEFSQEGHKTGKYDHDTCKPETLTRALILTCSRPNDLLFVPFAGSGTECAMALREGRRAIGYDIKQQYVEMANKRCSEILAKPQLF